MIVPVHPSNQHHPSSQPPTPYWVNALDTAFDLPQRTHPRVGRRIVWDMFVWGGGLGESESKSGVKGADSGKGVAGAGGSLEMALSRWEVGLIRGRDWEGDWLKRDLALQYTT